MESTTAVEHEGRDSATKDGNSAPDPTYEREGKGITFESVLQRSEVVAYFAALLDGLKHGQLQFRHGDALLSLAPTDQLAVEITANRKGNREAVSLELEWERCTHDAVGMAE